jgi:hypothetical protein
MCEEARMSKENEQKKQANWLEAAQTVAHCKSNVSCHRISRATGVMQEEISQQMA